MAATITAVARDPGSGGREPVAGSRDPIRLSTRPFARDERTDVVDAPRVEHVFGLDPAATRRANAEPHLAREPFGPVTVAVDRDGDTGRRGAACDGAVHVEMSGCAIDFHRRSRFRCCLKQHVKVQSETGPEARRETRWTRVYGP